MSDPFACTKPCETCPFRVHGDKPIRHLHPDAVRDYWNAQNFFCHSLYDYDNHSEDKRVSCAGFLKAHETEGTPSQMMRIGQRLRLYDPTKLDTTVEVFTNVEDMVAAQGED